MKAEIKEQVFYISCLTEEINISAALFSAMPGPCPAATHLQPSTRRLRFSGHTQLLLLFFLCGNIISLPLCCGVFHRSHQHCVENLTGGTEATKVRENRRGSSGARRGKEILMFSDLLCTSQHYVIQQHSNAASVCGCQYWLTVLTKMEIIRASQR